MRDMRVEAGAVVDEFDLPGIGHVVARHNRIKAPNGGVTWACMFTVAPQGTNDLAVVHRLSAPSLAEGRRSVRHAVEFLVSRALIEDAARAARAPFETSDVSRPTTPTSDDHAWRPPAGQPVYTGTKRERRVALSPSRGYGRRWSDLRRRDPDRGRIPDLTRPVADPVRGAPSFGLPPSPPRPTP